MRKILTFLLVGVLLLASLSVLVGCDVEPGVGPDQPQTPTPETLNLVENGASEYRIVIPDPASKVIQSQAIALRRAIQTVTGVQLKLVNDWEDKDNNADIKEILIGNTNRAASSAAMNALNDKDYSVTCSGNKVVFAAKTDELIEMAVLRFLSECLGYRSAEDYQQLSALSIPGKLNISGTRDIVLYIANEHLSYVDALQVKLTEQFGSVKVATSEDDFSKVFSSTASQLVIVAGVDVMPREAQTAMQAYLNDEGRVLLLGGPAFEKPYQLNGEYLTLTDYKADVIEDLDEEDTQVLVDPRNVSKYWSVKPDGQSGPVTNTVGNYGLSGSLRQMFFDVDNFSSWVTYSIKVDVTLDKANVISFYAKTGDNNTGAFSFEIVENNGARWRAKVPVSNGEWSFHTFFAEDFEHFEGATQSKVPDLTKITTIKFSFEKSYTGLAEGYHSCYVSDVIISNVKDDEAFNNTAESALALNGVAPLYEQYPLTNAADISADAGQIFVSDRDYVIPTGTNTLVSRYPGITAAGYGKDTDIRFIPLLTVTDAKGLFSGYAAWIDLYTSHTSANGKQEGSMVGYFGMATDEFYNANGIAAVVEAATAMTRNAFIVDGGTTEFTYLSGETDSITAGIKYVTLNDFDSSSLKATVALYQGNKQLAQYVTGDSPALGFSNSIEALQGIFNVSKGTPDRVVATLSLDGQVIDRVEHDIHYWAPKPAAERSYIYTEDGYFKKDGKIINFFGINYFPSYQCAAPDDDTKKALKKITSTYDSFFSEGGYNPEVIANDLKRFKDLGMNAVAIQAGADHIAASNNLLDFLRICEEHGFYVDIYLGSHAYPLRGYDGDIVKDMIQRLHLHENDNIIAFDIAWEERVGNYEGAGRNTAKGRYIGRQAWDDEWVEWVKVQYGSVSEALKAWGNPSGLSASRLVITDDMLDNTTDKYQKVAAAYQRFIDDIVSTSMQENFSHIQSLAPDQLISFRMSMSGSARRVSSNLPSFCYFDFQSLASSMAFMEPEGYELGGSDEACLQIMFANAYARYTKPDAPIVWKEFGKSVWAYRDDGNFYQSEAKLADVANYYEYVLDYCYESYTSGMFCWWSLSGYRLNEDSDYGIINPDGSDRGEITALLREYAPKFINQGERKDTVYIEVERDDHVGGLFGMYESVKNQLAAAYKSGKSVTFVDKSQNADHSYAYADTLLNEYVADAKTASGTAPLRYVNGIIKSFDVVTEGGKTYAEVTICNTKQSIWRADTVSLVSTDASDVAIDYTIAENVDYLEDYKTEKFEIQGKGDVALRFEIDGIAFGPLFTTTVK